MFENAIEQALMFARPMMTIYRHHGSTVVERAAATILVVNDEGWALTCKHVADNFTVSGQLIAKRAEYAARVAALAPDDEVGRNALDSAYWPSKANVCEVKNALDLVEGSFDIRVVPHPTLDLALVQISNFTRLRVDHFPRFAPDGAKLRQGKVLCRLGYPFSEFTNYSYDGASDSIDWTADAAVAPVFPIDGLVTRFAHDGTAFEMSTPGLKGQSGGPAFDQDGVVWGMQQSTNFMDLDFEVDIAVRRDGRAAQLRTSGVLYVGVCISAEAMKSFMRDNGVRFDVA